MLKKIGIIIFTCLCAILIAATPVFAKNNCKKSGCTRQPVSGPNRDGYCYEHSPRNKAVRCKESGCTSNAYHGSSYCSMHECVVTSCRNKKIKGLGVCISHRNLQNSNSSSSGNKKNNKNGSKKKPKYEMPDCDDYDSYEDFMDDWDGCMPDGSDAEDYWENW